VGAWRVTLRVSAWIQDYNHYRRSLLLGVLAAPAWEGSTWTAPVLRRLHGS
jgi:hypothetical protein